MKLLIVSLNYAYFNNMYVNYFNSLAEVSDVTFYGPGFSEKNELKNGILHFLKVNEDFDAIIVDFLMFTMSLKYNVMPSIRTKYFWHRYLLSEYSISEAIRYTDKILEQIQQIDTTRILMYTEDTSTIREIWVDCIRKFLRDGFYLLSLGEDFVPETIYDGACFGSLPMNNAFFHLLKDFPEKSISIPIAAVVCNDYSFRPLEKRNYDWIVPGSRLKGAYHMRNKMDDLLKSAGYKVFENNSSIRAMKEEKDMNRMEYCHYYRDEDRYLDAKLQLNNPYLPVRITREAVASWRESYLYGIQASKVAYADGGNSRQLVHKFMEIPASGTLLAGENVCGLEKMGFQNGENMVIVNEDNILDISQSLFKNSELMQRIANSGRKLVLKCHTSHSRAQDTIRAIRAIKNHNFYGSYWSEGNFHIKSN